jgi:hypothetical protein
MCRVSAKRQAKMVLILRTMHGPNSLLSVMCHLLERMILQRIQSLIEAATPVYQYSEISFWSTWNRFSITLN